MRSSLEIYDLDQKASRVLYQTEDLIEAPNWDADRDALIFNSGGLLYRIGLTDHDIRQIDTGHAKHCNNDHGLSPDGRRIVISDNTPDRGSEIYTLPAEGGALQKVTTTAGSYWHGWSPDGATLAFCGKRRGQFDIFTIPVSGGDETQLTGCEGYQGHNDGPDYSPDGKWIWFNSDRSGHAQIWKVRTDGTDAQCVFEDEFVNWFPHPSPDGALVLYLAYPPGTTGHPGDKDVALCLMQPDGSERRRILEFNGGQGSINVPCWAPDGRSFAYVRYVRAA